jgi:hypothetical protein
MCGVFEKRRKHVRIALEGVLPGRSSGGPRSDRPSWHDAYLSKDMKGRMGGKGWKGWKGRKGRNGRKGGMVRKWRR